VGKFREERRTLITEALQNAQIPNDDSIVSIYSKNYLANLYNILGMKKDRDRLIDGLKNRITLHPWAYFGMHCERDVKLFRMGGLMDV